MVRAFFVVASPGLLVRMYRGKSRWCMVADVWVRLADVSGIVQKRPVAGCCFRGDNSRGSRVCELTFQPQPVENKRRVRESEPQSALVAEPALIGCAASGVDDELHFNFTQATVRWQTSIFLTLQFPLFRCFVWRQFFLRFTNKHIVFSISTWLRSPGHRIYNLQRKHVCRLVLSSCMPDSPSAQVIRYLQRYLENPNLELSREERQRQSGPSL